MFGEAMSSMARQGRRGRPGEHHPQPLTPKIATMSIEGWDATGVREEEKKRDRIGTAFE